MPIITGKIALSVGSMLGLVAFGPVRFLAVPDVPIIELLPIGMAFGALPGRSHAPGHVAKVPALPITLSDARRVPRPRRPGRRQFFAGDRPEEFGALSVNTFWGSPSSRYWPSSS